MSTEHRTLNPIDLRRSLDEAMSFIHGVSLNTEVAIAAILAGDIRPDDNDGLIPEDDVAGRYAFGAIVSGDPRLWTVVHAL